MDMFGRYGEDQGEFKEPCALAALSNGGLVVRECYIGRLTSFKGLTLRFVWIAACVTYSSMEDLVAPIAHYVSVVADHPISLPAIEH